MFLEYGAQRPERSADAPGNRRAIDAAWISLFTRRLSRLLDMRAGATPQTNPQVVRLLDLAILSTYRDLQALGCEEVARSLLRGEWRDASGSGSDSDLEDWGLRSTSG